MLPAVASGSVLVDDHGPEVGIDSEPAFSGTYVFGLADAWTEQIGLRMDSREREALQVRTLPGVVA